MCDSEGISFGEALLWLPISVLQTLVSNRCLSAQAGAVAPRPTRPSVKSSPCQAMRLCWRFSDTSNSVRRSEILFPRAPEPVERLQRSPTTPAGSRGCRFFSATVHGTALHAPELRSCARRSSISHDAMSSPVYGARASALATPRSDRLSDLVMLTIIV